MLARELLCEFYEPMQDDLGVTDYDDTRRPRLTFHQLHRLRVAKDTEQLDKAEHKEFLPVMYNPPTE